jgi:hypothetical protein
MKMKISRTSTVWILIIQTSDYLTYHSLNQALEFTQHLTEINSTYRNNKCFWGLQSGWCMRPTTSLPSVNWMSRQCEILNISQPNRPPWAVTEVALLTFWITITKGYITIQTCVSGFWRWWYIFTLINSQCLAIFKVFQAFYYNSTAKYNNVIIVFHG